MNSFYASALRLATSPLIWLLLSTLASLAPWPLSHPGIQAGLSFALLSYLLPQIITEILVHKRPRAVAALALASPLLRLLALAAALVFAYRQHGLAAAQASALAFAAYAVAAMLFTVVIMLVAPIHGAGSKGSPEA